MSKITHTLLIIFFSVLSKYCIFTSKAIILPLLNSKPNEPNPFDPKLIISYYSKNNIYTYLKMGKPMHDLTVVFDDEDSSFIIKDGFCPSESDYTISESSTFKYDDGLIYQYINNELSVVLNNTKDKIYLNQADKEYFYSSLKNRKKGQNLNRIEIEGFSFLYSPTKGEINQLHKKKNKKTEKKDKDDLNGDGYNDDIYKNDDNDDNPFTPYYPGDNDDLDGDGYNDDVYKNDDDKDNDDDDNPFTPYYPGDEDDDIHFEPKCGYMGLLPHGITTGFNDAKLNFIQQLKNKRIIDNYNWYIRYNKDKTGELIIGAAPHEVRPENYQEEDFYLTHARLINDFFYWEIDFASVELFQEGANKRYNLGNKKGVIFINENFIHSPKSFFDDITSVFFKPYFEKQICKLQTITQYDSIFQTIYCHQRNFTENDLKKFPILLFQSNELNYIFNLDYNDLFLKTKNVYIYKVIYGGDYGYWKLGKTFLEKYQFVFNYDSKTFGFYQKFIPENIEGDQIFDPKNYQNNQNKGNEKLPPSKRKELRDKENNVKENKSDALKIVLIIGLIIVVIIIGFYLVRRFIFSKQVNSNIIENYNKFGKKRKIDNSMLDDAEEIN